MDISLLKITESIQLSVHFVQQTHFTQGEKLVENKDWK